MRIESNWNFKECVRNIKGIKAQYMRVLMSFSYFEPRKRGDFILKVRKKIYNINIERWKCGVLWDYLNDNLTLEKLEEICKHTN